MAVARIAPICKLMFHRMGHIGGRYKQLERWSIWMYMVREELAAVTVVSRVCTC